MTKDVLFVWRLLCRSPCS